MSEPDHATAEPDRDASEPECAMLEPDHAASEPDQVASEPDRATSEPDCAVLEPDCAMSEPDHATADPDCAISEPDHATAEPDDPAPRDPPPPPVSADSESSTLEPPPYKTSPAAERLKRRVVRAAERCAAAGRRDPGAAEWAALSARTGRDCHKLWTHMRALTLKKLARLAATDDRGARLSQADWLVFDRVLFKEGVDVITVPSDPEGDLTSWYRLAGLVAGAEGLYYSPDPADRTALIEGWLEVANRYNRHGRRVSPPLLQLRWHQLRRRARDRTLQFWDAYRGTRSVPAHAVRPAAVDRHIVKNFPQTVMERLPDWEEMLSTGQVVTAQEFQAYLKKQNKQHSDKPEESGPDLVLLEPHVETITVDDDAPDDATNAAATNAAANNAATTNAATTNAPATNAATTDATATSRITQPVKVKNEPPEEYIEEIDLEEDDDDLYGEYQEDTEIENVYDAPQTDSQSAIVAPREETSGEGTKVSEHSEVNTEHLSENNTVTTQVTANSDVTVVVDDDSANLTNDVSVSVDTNKLIQPPLEEDIETVKDVNEVISEDIVLLDSEDEAQPNLPVDGLCNVQIVQATHVPTEFIEDANPDPIEEDANPAPNPNADDNETTPNREDILNETEPSQLNEAIASETPIVKIEDVDVSIEERKPQEDSFDEEDMEDDLIKIVIDMPFEDAGAAGAAGGADGCGELSDESTNSKTDEEDQSKFDLKLLMTPVVYTTRLDQMTALRDTDYHTVVTEALISLVLEESKPVSDKSVTTAEQDRSVEKVSDDKRLSGDNLQSHIDEQLNESTDKSHEDIISFPNDEESSDEETPRVNFQSKLFRKPERRQYLPQQICKNPDFNTTLKRLPIRFLAWPTNREYLKQLKPLTIDVCKSFERALIDKTVYLKNCPYFEPVDTLEPDIVLENEPIDKNDSVLEYLANKIKQEIVSNAERNDLVKTTYNESSHLSNNSLSQRARQSSRDRDNFTPKHLIDSAFSDTQTIVHKQAIDKIEQELVPIAERNDIAKTTYTESSQLSNQRVMQSSQNRDNFTPKHLIDSTFIDTLPSFNKQAIDLNKSDPTAPKHLIDTTFNDTQPTVNKQAIDVTKPDPTAPKPSEPCPEIDLTRTWYQRNKQERRDRLARIKEKMAATKRKRASQVQAVPEWSRRPRAGPNTDPRDVVLPPDTLRKILEYFGDEPGRALQKEKLPRKKRKKRKDAKETPPRKTDATVRVDAVSCVSPDGEQERAAEALLATQHPDETRTVSQPVESSAPKLVTRVRAARGGRSCCWAGDVVLRIKRAKNPRRMFVPPDPCGERCLCCVGCNQQLAQFMETRCEEEEEIRRLETMRVHREADRAVGRVHPQSPAVVDDLQVREITLGLDPLPFERTTDQPTVPAASNEVTVATDDRRALDASEVIELSDTETSNSAPRGAYAKVKVMVRRLPARPPPAVVRPEASPARLIKKYIVSDEALADCPISLGVNKILLTDAAVEDEQSAAHNAGHMYLTPDGNHVIFLADDDVRLLCPNAGNADTVASSQLVGGATSAEVPNDSIQLIGSAPSELPTVSDASVAAINDPVDTVSEVPATDAADTQPLVVNDATAMSESAASDPADIQPATSEPTASESSAPAMADTETPVVTDLTTAPAENPSSDNVETPPTTAAAPNETCKKSILSDLMMMSGIFSDDAPEEEPPEPAAPQPAAPPALATAADCVQRLTHIQSLAGLRRASARSGRFFQYDLATNTLLKIRISMETVSGLSAPVMIPNSTIIDNLARRGGRGRSVAYRGRGRPPSAPRGTALPKARRGRPVSLLRPAPPPSSVVLRRKPPAHGKGVIRLDSDEDSPAAEYLDVEDSSSEEERVIRKRYETSVRNVMRRRRTRRTGDVEPVESDEEPLAKKAKRSADQTSGQTNGNDGPINGDDGPIDGNAGPIDGDDAPMYCDVRVGEKDCETRRVLVHLDEPCLGDNSEGASDNGESCILGL